LQEAAMSAPLDDRALDLIFREARTRNGWSDAPVTEADIRAIYDLYKMAPTAANMQPARVVWIKSAEAKARLEPHLQPGNKAKTMKAPVTAIIGYDMAFNEHLPRIFPNAPGAKDWFPDPVAKEVVALRNGTLQAGYLILAARALGFDCGPMSGFDNAGVDKDFFAGTGIKSNFIVSIGKGTDENLYPRNPRLTFEEANTIL
jgi:3-hydroxypropanoate dehydrogenase